MEKSSIKHMIKGLIIFISFFLYSYIAYLPFTIFNIDPKQLAPTIKTIYSLDINLLFLCIVLLVYYKDFNNYFKDFKKNGWKYIRKYIKYWYIGLGLMIVINLLITKVTPVDIPRNEEIIRNLLADNPWYIIISTTIFAPLMEEIIFRKVIHDLITHKWLFVIYSGLIFGTAHVITSMTNLWELLYIISYGVLGSIFALAYEKTNNLLTAISLHAIHNTFLLLIYLLVF